MIDLSLRRKCVIMTFVCLTFWSVATTADPIPQTPKPYDAAERGAVDESEFASVDEIVPRPPMDVTPEPSGLPIRFSDNKLNPPLSTSSSSSSGSSAFSRNTATSSNTTAIVGIIGGVIVATLICGVWAISNRRAQEKLKDVDGATITTHQSSTKQDRKGTMRTDPFILMKDTGEDKHDIWNDPLVKSVRIPFKSVKINNSIAKGGYGEIYKGTYHERIVAVKKLLPENRRSLVYINQMFEEVKLMAMFEHPQIIEFIGVSWDAPSDVCIVTEFMDGGDLKSLLVQYDEEKRPMGFDAEKIRMAHEVSLAVVYLHTLDTRVMHRDLKSSNVLLTSCHSVKLSDFGVSREMFDCSSATMTTGVGSGLWMAPEILVGECYDEHADLFSLGIMLTELDTQKAPYALVKKEFSPRFPQTMLLQMIAAGTIRAEFSKAAQQSYPELVELGYSLLSINPNDRPSIFDVSYCLHQILRHN
jgi:serine/threonine-protein kinase TNNI3K